MGVTPLSAVLPAVPEPEPTGGTTPFPLVRFGMAHAVVLVACVVTAAVLAETGMPVKEVLVLLGGSISVGVGALVAVVTLGRAGGRIDRFKDAYRNSAR
ncbi:hypothetical protein [Streptomyces sp. NRRL F-5123]|uniref:hypothetical protein n=1 Tax=Streptomyces sp. NRRL F-5123 TaxID=1463856 RepID=UPI0004E231D3|nr:hypothetical protein [Streptomyces sp. NRRL F-5123]